MAVAVTVLVLYVVSTRDCLDYTNKVVFEACIIKMKLIQEIDEDFAEAICSF